MNYKLAIIPAFMITMAWFAHSTQQVIPTVDEEPKLSTDATKQEDVDTILDQPSSISSNEIKNTPLETDNTQQRSAIDRIRQQSQLTELHHALLADHDQYQRYPPENRRFLTIEQDPITQRYAIDQRTTVGKDTGYSLTLWSNQKFYLSKDQIKLFAVVMDAADSKVSTSFEAVLIFGQSRLQSLKFEDPDNDGIYSYEIDLSENNLGISQPGIYKVVIQNQAHQLTDAITFTLSQPDIQLTGNFKDQLTAQSNLMIQAEVEVSQRHRFYIQGSLYSSTGVAVGTTQFTQDLTPGKHWLPLNFSGLMIQDSQESGPYVLKQVSLAKVAMPLQRGPLVQPNYQTDSYTLTEFSDEAHQTAP